MFVLRDTHEPLVWRLVVDRNDRRHRRPGVRIEAAVFADRRSPIQVLRAVAHNATIFWARRSDPWDTDAHFVRGVPAARTSALPPVTLATFRACAAAAGSKDWWLYWMHYFADALGTTSEGVLQHGIYDLRPEQPARPHTPATFAAQRKPGCTFDLELTRTPSGPDADRVVMWRKHAERGVPPGLTYNWVCSPGDLLVDGHDRMFASLLEGQPARALRLTPVAYGGGERRLVGSTSFWATRADELYPFGRITPLPGGVSIWKREASDRLWATREASAPRLIETMMAGLESVMPGRR